MDQLVVVVAVLAIITLVGHGIWVAIGWMWRRLAGPPPAGAAPLRVCPRCGSGLDSGAGLCMQCGWPRLALARSRLLADLVATARQLDRFRQAGLLDAATHQHLLEAIEAERQAGRPAPAPAASPLAARAIPETPARENAPTSAGPPRRPEAADRAELSGRRPARPHPIALGQPPWPAAPPPPPRPPFARLLAGFMEEKNIRWGELVGGMLIVLCSIALVISLWSQIAEIPVLKFFIFTAVTAALFGVGLYTEHRWKLPTTSRGLLIIATLLVPLNFLAIAAFARTASHTAPPVIGGELVAFGLFLVLVYWAGRVIAPQGPRLVALGVLGPSAAQLLVRRFAGPRMDLAVLLGLGAVPLACYGGATIGMLRRARHWARLGKAEVDCLFILLGVVSFAAVVPLGLLAFKTGDVRGALRHLAPLVSLGGVPALAVGLVLWRRLIDPQLAGGRTAGTSIAVLGAVVLLAGIGLAWPDPAGILPVATVSCIALTVVAVLFEVPAAHLLAGPCLAIAYLVGFHVATGHVGWQVADPGRMTDVLISAASGTALAALVVVLAAGSELLVRRGRRLDGLFVAVAAAAVGLVSLALVTWYGFGRIADPDGAAWVYALFAAGSFWAAWRTRRAAASWAGSALALAALIQAFVYKLAEPWALSHPWQLALLAHASLGAAAAGLVERGGRDSRRVLGGPITWSALAGSLAAVPLLVLAASIPTAGLVSTRMAWLAAVWLALAVLRGWPVLFLGFQAALALAVGFGVIARLRSTAWFVGSPHPLLDPWSLQALGIALGLLSLGWVVVRFGFRRLAARRRVGVSPVASPLGGVASDAPAGRRAAGSRLLDPPWPAFDRVMTALVLIGLVALAAYGAAPGVARELAPADALAPLAVPAASWPIAGVPPEHALGAGSWALLGVLLVVLVAGLWERFQPWAVLGMMLAVAAACPLLAGRWQSQVATASALRWLAAGLLILASVPIWFRGVVARLARPLGWPAMARRSAGLARDARLLLAVLTIAPVLALTLYPAAAAIGRTPIAGQAAYSFFGRIGNAASYTVPLLLVSLALVGSAIRERSAVYASWAGLVLNLTVTLAYVLGVVTAGGLMGLIEWVRLIQLNAITTSGFALAWLAAVAVGAWRAPSGDAPAPGVLLQGQVGLGLAANLLVLGPAGLLLVLDPASPAELLAEAGSGWGWLAAILAAAAAGWLGTARGDRLPAGAAGAALAAIAGLLALGACRWDTGDWLGYHTLLAGIVAAAWLTLPLGWLAARAEPAPPPSPTPAPSPLTLSLSRWAAMIGGLGVVLALRATGGDPGRPWWSVGALIAVSLLAGGLARCTLSRGFLDAAGPLINLAATIGWLTEWGRPGWGSWIELLDVNVIALALPGVAWLVLECRALRPARPADSGRGPRAFHHVAALGSLAAVAGGVAIGLLADALERPVHPNVWLGWLALAAAAVLMVACLWDSAAAYAVAGCYGLGLVSIGMTLDQFHLDPHWLGWTGAMIAAAYSVGTSYLWSVRRGLARWADRLGLRHRADSPLAGAAWLGPANQVLAALVVVLAYWVDLTFAGEPALRLLAAKAALAQALAVGLLAQGARRSRLQQAALGLGVIGMVAWGWAWLEPGARGVWLNRDVVVLGVLAGMTAVYGVGLAKLFPAQVQWASAARRCLPWLIGAGFLSLGSILGVEVVEQASWRRVPMDWPAIIAVTAALVGLSATGLALAVLPGRDPLGLAERGRMSYVYAAEGCLALVFLHARLTMPWLFRGVFQAYWPLVVMAIAFGGVGLSDLFRRQGRLVLAEPLERTGAFLPLLPVLGFWALGSEVHYSGLLLLVGLLYGVLSITRRSFGFGLLAALAGNGGLWYLLHQAQGYGLFEHPQLWLIPAALSVLAAAYLNHDRLAPDQMAAVRYICLMAVYVSSTADIFINGVADSPWLPLVLAGLSIAGVLGGIVLRVRAFLFLGTAFLLLALITMIWHASVRLGWTWLWYVAGIVAGLLIILLFALFERNRTEVLRAVDGLKEWER